MEIKNIDYHILWKKFNATVTKEEQVTIDTWRSVSPKHERMYTEVEKFYTEGSTFKNNQTNNAQAYSLVSSKLRRRRWYNISAAASVILIVGISVGLINSKFSFTSNPQQIASVNVIAPSGQKKALLILEDGSEALLTSNSNVAIEQGNSKVLQSENGLSYAQSKSKTPKESFNTLLIPRGGEFYLELSDGTKVWLNSDTKLKYPVAFVSNERIVELTGEAYFEVAKDVEHPFIVVSSNQRVKVLGTQFNISNYQGDETIETTLVEGAVNVTTNEGDILSLKPGYQAVYTLGKHTISANKVDVSQFIAWKEGFIQFDNESLQNMLIRLERYYDVSFELNDNKLKEMRFTGKMKRYESLSEVLAIIEKTNEVSFTMEGSHVLVN